MIKNILITGGSGFLGSNLAVALLKAGHNVTLILRPNSDVNRLGAHIENFHIIRANSIRDTQYHVQKICPEIILHNACCYGRNGENHLEIIDANYRLGIALIQACTNADQPMSFINAGTSIDPMTNFYALTKHQFSTSGRFLALDQKRKLQFINLQLEHIYGPFDDKTKFTTHLIQSCRENRAELNLTNGTQLRDFVYIDDVVSAYLCIIENLTILSRWEHIEVGSGDAPPVRNLVKKVHELTKSSTKLNFGAIPFRPAEKMRSQANIERIKSLGWRPLYNQDSGIKKLLETEVDI